MERPYRVNVNVAGLGPVGDVVLIDTADPRWRDYLGRGYLTAIETEHAEPLAAHGSWTDGEKQGDGDGDGDGEEFDVEVMTRAEVLAWVNDGDTELRARVALDRELARDRPPRAGVVSALRDLLGDDEDLGG